MTQVMGGLRSRLVHDSFLRWLEDGLGELGWFDAGRRHLPITVLPKPLDWDQPVEPNLLAVTLGREDAVDAEVGSSLREERTECQVDLYAESDALGTQVIYDVRDMMRGKMPSIDRGRMVLPVYDYRMATPDLAFNVVIDEVTAGRLNREAPRMWERHWFQARCSLVDTNGGESYGE